MYKVDFLLVFLLVIICLILYIFIMNMFKIPKKALIISTAQLFLLGITMVIVIIISEEQAYIKHHQKYCIIESIQSNYWLDIKKFINDKVKSNNNFVYKVFSPSRGFGVTSCLIFIDNSTKNSDVDPKFNWELTPLSKTCFIGVDKKKQSYVFKNGFNKQTFIAISKLYIMLFAGIIIQFILLCILLKVKLKQGKAKNCNSDWRNIICKISVYSGLFHPVLASILLYIYIPTNYEKFGDPYSYNKLYSYGIKLLRESKLAGVENTNDHLLARYGINSYFVSKFPLKDEYIRFDLGNFNYIYISKEVGFPKEMYLHDSYKTLRPGMWLKFYNTLRSYQISIYKKYQWYFCISWGLLIIYITMLICAGRSRPVKKLKSKD